MTTLFKELRRRMKAVIEGASGTADDKPKTVWIERSKYISEAAHKVRVHSKDGKSEVRYVSDEELEVLHKEPNISRIVHITEDKAE